MNIGDIVSISKVINDGSLRERYSRTVVRKAWISKKRLAIYSLENFS